MLWLKRNIHYNELLRCHASKDFIAPGDYYYIDDQDGFIIKFDVYKDMKEQQKRENWDYTKINMAQNEREYKQLLEEATRHMLAETVLERKVANRNYSPTEESDFIKSLYAEAKEGKH